MKLTKKNILLSILAFFLLVGGLLVYQLLFSDDANIQVTVPFEIESSIDLDEINTLKINNTDFSPVSTETNLEKYFGDN